MYGATMPPRSNSCPDGGLSPCVRGYLDGGPDSLFGEGSIPVCTGLPSTSSGSFFAARVYPRVYGATPPPSPLARSLPGLSPCVRGYRHLKLPESAFPGSIPVCTGLPSSTGGLWPGSWVYPRVYGATWAARHSEDGSQGLSPCVRGYLHARARGRVGGGSIPVCTGLP